MNKLTEDRLAMKSCHALVVPIRRAVRQERPLGEKRCQANSAYTRGVKALKEMGNTPARSTYCSAPTDKTLSRGRECRLVTGLAGALTHTPRTRKGESLQLRVSGTVVKGSGHAPHINIDNHPIKRGKSIQSSILHL